MALLSFDGAPHGGSQRLIPEWRSQPKITPTAIIDHSIVGSGESAWQMFNGSSGLESHFIVLGRRSGLADGRIWQLVDTGHRGDANWDANGYAISIETEDDGDPDTQPWTGAQLRSLMWLHAELRRLHPTIPNRQSRSCGDPGGHGYHTLHGAPSCWTPSVKTCPGRVRVQQWRDVLLPAYLTGTPIPEDDMALTTEDKAWIAARLEESERRVARYVDHGTAETAGSDDHHERIRGDLAKLANDHGQLRAAIAEINAKLDGLALGKLEGDFDVTGVVHATASPPPPPP